MLKPKVGDVWKTTNGKYVLMRPGVGCTGRSCLPSERQKIVDKLGIRFGPDAFLFWRTPRNFDATGVALDGSGLNLRRRVMTRDAWQRVRKKPNVPPHTAPARIHAYAGMTFEETERYDTPKKGEWFLSKSLGRPRLCSGFVRPHGPRTILRPVGDNRPFKVGSRVLHGGFAATVVEDQMTPGYTAGLDCLIEYDATPTSPRGHCGYGCASRHYDSGRVWFVDYTSLTPLKKRHVFEETGEVRIPNPGEYYLEADSIFKNHVSVYHAHPILRKVE